MKLEEMAWCDEHRCWHHPDSELPSTEEAVIAAIYRESKLTTRQAKRYGLAIDKNVVVVPHHDREEGWFQLRYRWRLDGGLLKLEQPDDMEKPSQN
jgi:hypothetical protein